MPPSSAFAPTSAAGVLAAGLLSATALGVGDHGHGPRELPPDHAAAIGLRPWRADHVQRRSLEHPPRRAEAPIEGAIPVVMAGSASAAPPDHPQARIDPNDPSSPWAGVCSIRIEIPEVGVFLCSAVAIDERHVLTAAHCFDIDADGAIDPGATASVLFNHLGDAAHVVPAEGVERVFLHPAWTGFDAPSLNDDLAILRLHAALPPEIPRYPPFDGPVADGQELAIVGYGASGYGDEGHVIPASTVVKRVGGNVVESYVDDDEGSGTLEYWIADFDPPQAFGGCDGGPGLGNLVETSVAPGDSGGPVLVHDGTRWRTWGNGAWIADCAGEATTFGARFGGMVASAYLAWFDAVVDCGGNCGDCDGNGIADGLDILAGTAADENGDLVPDACQHLQPGDAWLATYDALVAVPRDPARPSFRVSLAPGATITGLRIEPGGDLLLAVRPDDGTPGRIERRDAATGAPLGVLADGDDGVLEPLDVAFAPDGTLLVLDDNGPGSALVARHDAATGARLDVLVPPGSVLGADSMVVLSDGRLVVLEIFGTGLPSFDVATGAFLGDLGSGMPVGIETDVAATDGALLVAAGSAGAVRRVDLVTGAYTGAFGGGFTWPETIAVARPDGAATQVLVADRSGASTTVRAFDAATGSSLGVVLAGIPDAFPRALRWIPPAAPAADLDGDGTVGFGDVLVVLSAWGPCPDGAACAADLDGDGTVAFGDVLAVLAAWDAPGG